MSGISECFSGRSEGKALGGGADLCGQLLCWQQLLPEWLLRRDVLSDVPVLLHGVR